ncbi:hypothetical protein [Methylobacterium sp. 1973]|uniref:hypothetical protein n=1 Tax=Methylobacterium sp. 1973 TaxID=3156421 RepID=UPI0006ADDD87|nr:hypothetical protein ADL19_10530 [Streptomyces purpurogeneiscleroticus]
MAGRVTDQSPDETAVKAHPETERSVPRPGTAEEAEAVERHRAETDVAAGDVADDLADFA